nr:hypothetical protein [uncultured Prevotella sp.]
MSYNDIIKAFNEHLKKSGKQFYNDFYIGITDDIERRLFTEHKVPKEGHWFIYAHADNSLIARNVEKYFLDLGMRGGQGGGDTDTEWVYCYIVSQYTTE